MRTLKKRSNRTRTRVSKAVGGRMPKHGRYPREAEAIICGKHRANAGSGNGRASGIRQKQRGGK